MEIIIERLNRIEMNGGCLDLAEIKIGPRNPGSERHKTSFLVILDHLGWSRGIPGNFKKFEILGFSQGLLDPP